MTITRTGFSIESNVGINQSEPGPLQSPYLKTAGTTGAVFCSLLSNIGKEPEIGSLIELTIDDLRFLKGIEGKTPFKSLFPIVATSTLNIQTEDFLFPAFTEDPLSSHTGKEGHCNPKTTDVSFCSLSSYIKEGLETTNIEFKIDKVLKSLRKIESDEIIKKKLDLLKLAKDLGNVSKACQQMGCSKTFFYNCKNRYQEGGEAALQKIIPEKISIEAENRVVAFSIENPGYGRDRVWMEIHKQGILISPKRIQSIWKKRFLNTPEQRLEALKAKMGDAPLSSFPTLPRKITPEITDIIKKMRSENLCTVEIVRRIQKTFGVGVSSKSIFKHIERRNKKARQIG